MKYDAFISYSHAADGRLAPAVQAGLQRLTKPWWKLRVLHVFRDETGLAVDPHMWSSIQAVLDDSAWFILLASPEAAASRWVNKEIEHWLVSNPAERILPVLTSGTVNWDDVAEDFTVESDAIPPALRGAFRDEPRYLDLRWAQSEDDLDLRHPRFKSAVAALAAPIHGIARERLETEDVSAHRRTRRVARGALAAVIVLAIASVASTAVAWRYATDANRSRRLKENCAALEEAARSASGLFYANFGRYPSTFTALTSARPPLLMLPHGATVAIARVAVLPKSSYIPRYRPVPPGAMDIVVFDASGKQAGNLASMRLITHAPNGTRVTQDFVLVDKRWSMTMSGGGGRKNLDAPTFSCLQ